MARVARLTQLSGLHPKSAAVQLNLGLARFWAGEDGAKAAWQSAAELEPDTAYAVTAGNLLHPNFARNLPIFVPTGELPAAIRRLPPPAQFAALERRGRNGTVADRLFYGVGAATARTTAFRRARVRRGRTAPAGRSRSACCCGGRAVRQDAARQGVRTTRPADAYLPAKPRRSASTSGSCCSGRARSSEARRQLRLVGTVDPGSPLVGVAKRYLDELRAAGI